MCKRRLLELSLPDEGYFDLAMDASARIVATLKAERMATSFKS